MESKNEVDELTMGL
jgi:Ran GTPase-activating protein (RanGAP) involved in mRNA processing and transport